MEVVWNCRDAELGELVQKCAEGSLPYNELYTEFARRGRSTLYLFEAVRNAEIMIERNSQAS